MTTLNLEMVRGSAKNWPFDVYIEGILAGAAGGGPAITGASIWFTAKSAFTDADSAAIFQLTVGSGITINTASRFTVSPTADQTEAIARTVSKTTLKWDVKLRYSDGSGPYTLAYGDLVVHTNATLAPNE